MEDELRQQWVGPMPVEEFFDEFLPGSSKEGMPTVEEDYFATMPRGKKVKESEMYDPYDPMIKLVKDKRLLPGFQMVNTSKTPDANSKRDKKIKQDMATYKDDVDVSNAPTQMDKDLLSWEVKPSAAAEPFADPLEGASPEHLKKHKFETDTDAGRLTRGQIATYLIEICARQHRTHAFMIFMTDTKVRFLRGDRTGIVVSRSFNYRTNSKLLAEFLWRFSQVSDVVRGLDPTVRPASVEEEALAKEHLSEWAPEESRAIVVLQVPDSDDKRAFREVITWGSMSDAYSLTGRATRCWPVYDLKAKNVAFLKDSWRSVLDCLVKESSTLKELTAANVRYVPKYICGDDLGQITRTQDFVEAAWKAGPTSESVEVSRAHHRLLTDTVGHRLIKFKSSKQLMQAIYHAYLAHTDAYTICGILHRDISAGNILLSVDGTGILNDWDMARKVKDIRNGPRQPGRTGTWLFMSIKLLKNPSALHELQDDLESFCYVVIYVALRYLPHNVVSDLPTIMANVFENQYTTQSVVRGGRGKSAMVRERDYFGQHLRFTDNEPLTAWVQIAFRVIKDWRCYLDYLDEWCSPQYVLPGTCINADYDSGLKLKDRPMRNHKALDNNFQLALAKTWPENDTAVDHLPHDHKRISKRTREEEDEEPAKKKFKTSMVFPSKLRSVQPLLQSPATPPRPLNTTM